MLKKTDHPPVYDHLPVDASFIRTESIGNARLGVSCQWSGCDSPGSMIEIRNIKIRKLLQIELFSGPWDFEQCGTN